MTTPSLTTLLEILKNPESPAYAQAIQQLKNINPALLPPEQLPALLAQLESTKASLLKQQAEVSQQLGAQRTRNQALKAYGK